MKAKKLPTKDYTYRGEYEEEYLVYKGYEAHVEKDGTIRLPKGVGDRDAVVLVLAKTIYRSGIGGGYDEAVDPGVVVKVKFVEEDG